MSAMEDKQVPLDVPELWATLQDLEDGSLSEERRNALVKQLNHSPAARRAYHEYFHQVAVLRMEAAKLEASGELASVRPVVTFRPWWRQSWMAVAAVLVLACVIGALVLRPGGGPAPVQVEAKPVLKARPAAGALWEINGVRQAGATNQVDVKEGDSIHVLSGLVQLETSSGSILVLPGASRASFPQPFQPVLHEGWLWIDTGASEDEFQVFASDLVVRDIGTRFGVRIGEEGRSEIHLLEGGVNVISRESGIKLTTLAPDGSGRTVRGDGSLRAVPLAEDPFPMLQSQLFGETAYENVVLSQMPSGYWKFDAGVDGRFDNAVRGGRSAKSGPSVKIHSEGVESGWAGFGPSNQSLYLPAYEAGRWSTSVVAFLDGGKGLSSQQGAVTFWINRKKHAAEDQILWLAGKPHPDKPGPTESLAYTYLTASGHLGFTMTNGNRTVSAESKETLEPGRWHQVGISWSKTGMDLYLNGQRVGQRSGLAPGEEWTSYGNFIRFGKPTDELQRKGVRSFHGWFDEYALWNRALTPEEVAQQYKAAQGDRAD